MEAGEHGEEVGVVEGGAEALGGEVPFGGAPPAQQVEAKWRKTARLAAPICCAIRLSSSRKATSSTHAPDSHYQWLRTARPKAAAAPASLSR